MHVGEAAKALLKKYPDSTHMAIHDDGFPQDPIGINVESDEDAVHILTAGGRWDVWVYRLNPGSGQHALLRDKRS